MQLTAFRSLVFTTVTLVIIAVSSCAKQEEGKKQETPTAAANKNPGKEAPAPVSSPPPTGQWMAVEDKSDGVTTVITVHFSEYSSHADVQAVAYCEVANGVRSCFLMLQYFHFPRCNKLKPNFTT